MIPKIPIIYYHSIAPLYPDWNRNFLSIAPDLFEKQIVFLKKFYSFITIKEYYQARKTGKNNKRNPILLTIDDGFLDNWLYAFPILKKHEIPATIFISPEMVDKREIVRTISSNVSDNFGYMSWDEMRIMESSGLVDFQSHTMSHTKYSCSDKLVSFHHPNADCLYPVGNLFPDRKPYHIADKDFEKLLPYGFPFFEEKSSVISRKIKINPEFIEECLKRFENYDFHHYNYALAFEHIMPIYKRYKDSDALITNCESEEEYKKRVFYEVVESKRIIEAQLNKEVEFLCWPHGDNNDLSHEIAINNGYKATTIGKADIEDSVDRISQRFGIGKFWGSTYMGLAKAQFKIADFKGSQLGRTLKKVYRLLLKRT